MTAVNFCRLLVIISIAGLALIAYYGKAQAHDWYTGISNPTSGEGCCGGNDCYPLQLEDFVEKADEFVITIVVPLAKWPGWPPGVYRFRKDSAMPTRHIDDGESGYHACIWGKKARCFFFPSSS